VVVKGVGLLPCAGRATLQHNQGLEAELESLQAQTAAQRARADVRTCGHAHTHTDRHTYITQLDPLLRTLNQSGGGMGCAHASTCVCAPDNHVRGGVASLTCRRTRARSSGWPRSTPPPRPPPSSSSSVRVCARACVCGDL
jgi:hypothetical protein